MIYIIFDKSFEWDDFTTHSKRVVYVGTDKEAAIDFFQKKFGDTEKLDNTKYCYKYSLYEYIDGWNPYSTDTDIFNLLMSATNYKEES